MNWSGLLNWVLSGLGAFIMGAMTVNMFEPDMPLESKLAAGFAAGLSAMVNHFRNNPFKLGGKVVLAWIVAPSLLVLTGCSGSMNPKVCLDTSLLPQIPGVQYPTKDKNAPTQRCGGFILGVSTGDQNPQTVGAMRN